MNELTFGNSAALLKANGYAPIPLGTPDLRPLGPVYVMQIDWARNSDHADAPVAVLTSVPMPQGPHAPIQNAQDTWLTTVTVTVRDELKGEVDAIVKRYAGDECLPARIADGEALYVFKLAGERFSTITTAYGHQPDTVRVDSAASFVALNGQWENGISLLDISRNELAPLSRDHAQALIDEVDRLLSARAPRIASVLPPRVPRPLLEPGQTLRYGNTRAMDVLRGHGFQPYPVRWGHNEVERDGYNDFMGRLHYNVNVAEHGVGIDLKGFALVQFGARLHCNVNVDEAIRAMGSCLIRTAAGDDRPAYLFRCDQGGAGETIFSPNVHVHVRRAGLIVLSGADDKGREYKWSRDPLTVNASELAAFELHDGDRLRRMLESLPPTDYSKGSGKRRKTAA